MSTDTPMGMETVVPAPNYAEEPYLPLTAFSERDPELWLYRERTIAILAQYFRFSIEVGRLPSILGREFFRAKVSSY